MKRSVIALALVVGGCADNAILELELTLPSVTVACGAGSAAVEARIPREGGCFFDQEWLDGDRAVLPIDTSESTHEISVVATGEDVTRTLCVRVRGCRADECPPPEITVGARADIEIERAFYLGRYTELALGPIDLCASSTTIVPPCEVRCEAPAPSCDPSAPHPCE